MTDTTTTTAVEVSARPVAAARKSVENSDFDAFVRRVLRAYGRRVADGDIEALRSLAELAAEIDAVTRLAVVGLRGHKHPYTWSEIADRLGVTKQAAQMRYGTHAASPAPVVPVACGRSGVGLDRRLVDAGLSVTVPELVAVFADHHPGQPPATTCPGCGYRYPDPAADCPSAALARPLLHRRRAEHPRALGALSPIQFADLHHGAQVRVARASVRQAARPAPGPAHASSLLDLITREDPTS